MTLLCIQKLTETSISENVCKAVTNYIIFPKHTKVCLNINHARKHIEVTNANQLKHVLQSDVE